jgi:hypothetical protein
MSFSKEQLVKAAKSSKVGVSGNKSELCAKILRVVRKDKKQSKRRRASKKVAAPPARAPRVPAPIVAPVVQAPTQQTQQQQKNCYSYSNDQLKQFLRHFDHEQIYKMNKDAMCEALQTYIDQGQFRWTKPHYKKIAAEVFVEVQQQPPVVQPQVVPVRQQQVPQPPQPPQVVRQPVAQPISTGTAKILQPNSVKLSFKAFNLFVNNFKIIEIWLMYKSKSCMVKTPSV